MPAHDTPQRRFAVEIVERLRVADRGIREGILRTLMNRDGHWV